MTFLFTDIEGSTRLLQNLGPRYHNLLERHRQLLRAAFEAEHGYEVNAEGDAFFIAFSSAARGVAAAIAAQRSLANHSWPEGAAVRVRMGLHTGEAALVGGDYVGLDIHRAARIAAAAWGAQIVISYATAALVEHVLPAGARLRDLGEHRLKDLLRPERLVQVVVDGLPAEFPPLRTLDAAPNNLPVQLTTFIGREREVAEARSLLEGTRLLTLTGPGGTGKTRLALQLAADLVDRLPDGVFFVPLAPISDADLVPSTIAQVLGLQDSSSKPPLDRVLEHLRDKHLLLLLDNFEQILAAAPVVATLLTHAPALKIVVTSRAALRVYGEQEFPVPPMRLPDPRHLPALESLSQYEAVALFIQRAVTVKPDFRITNENAPAVAEITARLDGLPLAIELAAARVKLLPPQAILSRLQHRLTLLSGGMRDLPARQQTLRGAIAWSYDLLDDGGRRLFARLAVFVGGSMLEEAEAVCGPADELEKDILDGLAALVDHSLLRQEASGGEPRFVMLETIREFALDRLDASGEAEEIRRRHAATFLKLAEDVEPHLLGSQPKIWLDRLEREHDNLRAAIMWAVERDEAELALRLAAALWRFWQRRGHLQEARERLDKALAMPRAFAFTGARAKALEAAGGIVYWQGDMEGARKFYEESLALWRELGDKKSIANALYNLAFVFLVPRTDMDRGRSLIEQSLALYEELEDKSGIARTHWMLANLAHYYKDYRAARAHLAVCLPIFRALESRFDLAWALHQAGLTEMRIGEHGAARAAFSESLTLFEEAGDIPGLAILLDDLSQLAVAEGDLERAARLAGKASALQVSSGMDLATLINAAEGRSRPGEQGTDQQALTTAWEQGRAMSTDEIVAYALQRSPAT